MGTVQIARWARESIEQELWEADPDVPGQEIRRVFLDTSFGLDPCGRFHHMLSPNGVTTRCVAFWESLESQLAQRHLFLTSGDGDPCDHFAEEYREAPASCGYCEEEFTPGDAVVSSPRGEVHLVCYYEVAAEA